MEKPNLDKISDQEEFWIRHIHCLNSALSPVPSALPVVWREPKDNATCCCCFGLTDICGRTYVNKRYIE
jgi:hypothetical protein